MMKRFPLIIIRRRQQEDEDSGNQGARHTNSIQGLHRLRVPRVGDEHPTRNPRIGVLEQFAAQSLAVIAAVIDADRRIAL